MSGTDTLGRPVGTSEITAMPSAGKSKARLHPIEIAVTMSAHGTSGASRRSTSNATSDAAPTRNVGQLMSPRPASSRHSISGTFPLSTGIADELRDLPHDDHDPDSADEPDEHRAGEKLGDEAEAKEPGSDEDHAGEDREPGEQRHVRDRRERRRHGHEHCSRRDRDRRARPDVELAAGAEDRVEDAGAERRRETGLRGAPASAAYATAWGTRTAHTASAARRSRPRNDRL